MTAIAGQSCNIGIPHGKMNKLYFSETTNFIKPKLYMNNLWMAFTKYSFLIWGGGGG